VKGWGNVKQVRVRQVWLAHLRQSWTVRVFQASRCFRSRDRFSVVIQEVGWQQSTTCQIQCTGIMRFIGLCMPSIKFVYLGTVFQKAGNTDLSVTQSWCHTGYYEPNTESRDAVKRRTGRTDQAQLSALSTLLVGLWAKIKSALKYLLYTFQTKINQNWFRHLKDENNFPACTFTSLPLVAYITREVYYRIHGISTQARVPCQLNPIYISTSYFRDIPFDIILPFAYIYILSWCFGAETLYAFISFSYVFYITLPPCPTLCTGWSKSFCAPDDDQKVSVHLTMIKKCTFGMWTVLYWTRSSRTQFSVSINVWKLAGDTLNITCNFLYCNHQAQRDFLITL
jgi:hypothetical protein